MDTVGTVYRRVRVKAVRKKGRSRRRENFNAIGNSERGNTVQCSNDQAAFATTTIKPSQAEQLALDRRKDVVDLASA